jgi:hypothetical protein
MVAGKVEVTGKQGRKLVVAARLQNRHDHKLRVRKQPFLGFSASRLSRLSHGSQMLVSREAAEMFQANARQRGHFVFGEDLLAGFDAHHSRSPESLMLPPE